MTQLSVHLIITFSNQRFSNCSPTVMLDLWSSHQTVFLETGSSGWIFGSAVTCAEVVLWFLETILLNVQRSLSVNVDSCPLFLFNDDVFPWFMYDGDIILETVILNTPNNTVVFVTHAPAHQWSVLFTNWTSLPFSNFFTQTVTQHNH
jgi:hypothetical protein